MWECGSVGGSPSYVLSCRNHFSHDNYTQMTVETEDQYQGVLDVFPYRNYELEKAVFPKVFPFSACVPQVYKLLKDFIDQSISYDRDLDIRYVCRSLLNNSTTIIIQ